MKVKLDTEPCMAGLRGPELARTAIIRHAFRRVSAPAFKVDYEKYKLPQLQESVKIFKTYNCIEYYSLICQEKTILVDGS